MPKPKVRVFTSDGQPLEEHRLNGRTRHSPDLLQGMAEIRRAIRKAIVEIESLEKNLQGAAGSTSGAKGVRDGFPQAESGGNYPAIEAILKSPVLHRMLGTLIANQSQK